MAGVELDLGSVPEPVAGRFGGGNNDTLDQDTPVNDRDDLGLFLNGRCHCGRQGEGLSVVINLRENCNVVIKRSKSF